MVLSFCFSILNRTAEKSFCLGTEFSLSSRYDTAADWDSKNLCFLFFFHSKKYEEFFGRLGE